MTLSFLRSSTLTISLLAFLPCLLFSDTDDATRRNDQMLSPEVKDIIDPVSKKLKTIKDFSADFDYTKEITLLEYSEFASGHLKSKRPDRFRMDFTKPTKKTIVSNGDTLYIHLPDLNQVQTFDLSRQGVPGAVSSNAVMMRPDEMLSVDVWLRSFRISLAGDVKNDIKKTHILKLIPLNDQIRVPYEKMLIWIDRKRSLPVRIRTFESDGEIISTWSFRNIRTDSDVPDSFFEFIPPKGSEVIDL